jgi:sulfur carrier protein ThiS adenylyltransferase
MTSIFYENLKQKMWKNNLNKLRKMKIGAAVADGFGSNYAANIVRICFEKNKLVDFDIVEAANLDLQFYFTDQLGMHKVAVLRQNLLRINHLARTEIEIKKID